MPGRRPMRTRDEALTYPESFAARVLDTWRPRRFTDDTEGLAPDQIRYVDDSADGVDATIQIDDKGIEPAWVKLRWLGIGFQPKLPVEEAVMTVLWMDIASFCGTNYAPPPRFFTIGEVLASYSRDRTQ